MNDLKMYKDVEGRVKEIIVDYLEIDENINEISFNEEDFLGNYGFNSVDALDLLLKLEQEFEIEIDDEHLNAELISTGDSIVSYIVERLKVNNF